MSTSRSVELTVKLVLTSCCDYDDGYEIEVDDILPRKTFGNVAATRCHRCEDVELVPGARMFICHACAVEETICNVGVEYWLTEIADFKTWREGTLELVGTNVWTSLRYLDDWDVEESFEVREVKWS